MFNIINKYVLWKIIICYHFIYLNRYIVNNMYNMFSIIKILNFIYSIKIVNYSLTIHKLYIFR